MTMDLEENETILILVRESKFLLILKIFLAFFILAIPFIAEEVVGFFWFGFSSPPVSDIWALIKDMYLLLGITGTYLMLVLYHLNVHIVTNKRVIDSDQYTLTQHRVVEAHLNRIQDVAADITGFWGNIINYGDVKVQTAGEHPNINFENVSDPRKIKRLILDEAFKHGKHATHNHPDL